MKYFTRITSLSDLKTQYRALAMQHHPDRGGDLKVMQAVNAEYDSLHQIWNTRRASDEGYESAEQFRYGFYREQGWQGANYNSDLRVKEIAVLFRAYVKKHWPQCRFSVRSSYNSVSIALVSAPFSPWADLENAEIAQAVARRKLDNPYYDAATIINRGHMDVNHYYIDDQLLLSPSGKLLFKDLSAFIQSYNFDHSDIQSDYFHVNFYLTLAIGRWDKPFVQKGDMPLSESTDLANQNKAA
ncbi:MAG: hypothetical protein DELT_00516 [Desulfovibrio sp.]